MNVLSRWVEPGDWIRLIMDSVGDASCWMLLCRRVSEGWERERMVVTGCFSLGEEM